MWGIHLSSACLPRCGNHQASCAIRITRLPLLLLCSSSPPSRPRDQSRARAEGSKGQGARSEEQGARRQWSNHQWSNEHRRLHAKYSSRRANRGSVALCSYVALPIVSTEPSLSVPNRPSWSPPIFSGYYVESKRKYSVRTVLCCAVLYVPKSSALLVAQRITAGEDAARDRRPGSSRRECQVMPTLGVACSGQGLRAPP